MVKKKKKKREMIFMILENSSNWTCEGFPVSGNNIHPSILELCCTVFSYFVPELEPLAVLGTWDAHTGSAVQHTAGCTLKGQNNFHLS